MRSIWELIKRTADSWNEINAPRLGAALSYYTMMSIAPLLVICVGIAGVVFGRQAAQSQIVGQIRDLVGPQGGRAIEDVLKQAATPAAGITAAVIGLFVLLFSASGVLGELRDSLNMVWGAKPTGSTGLIAMIRYRFVSFAMVLGIGFLLMVSLILSAGIAAAGKFLGGYLPLPEGLLHFSNLVISLIAFTIVFALLYKLVPDVHIEWRDVWIGAGVTSLLFSFGKFLIGLYLGKAAVGSAYGAAGSLVVFLVWVYYSAQIFFLGAEFTRNFSERHGSRADRHEKRQTPAAPRLAFPQHTRTA